MVNKIISEDYLDLLVENSLIDFEKEGDNVTPINEKHSILHVLNQFADKCDMKDYQYKVFRSLFFPEAKIRLEKSGITQVYIPGSEYLGQGMLVGVIDTGIEYQHEAFLNPDETSRIISIWDQSIQDGEKPPEGFNYGAEYTQQMINEALKNKNPLSIVPTTDEVGHGTMVAGIVAGNDNPKEEFSGVVPQAEMIVVKLKQAKKVNKNVFLVPTEKVCYQDSDIMLGVKYVISVAEQLRRPLVLCMAVGTSQGGHDGHGPLGTYLTLVMQKSRMAVVTAGGNEGNTKRHYLGNMQANQKFIEFNLQVSSKDTKFSMELWTTSPSQVAIDMTSPTGEYVEKVYPGVSECVKHAFRNESSVAWVNNIIAEGEFEDQMIWMRFMNPQEGMWHFKVYNIGEIPTKFNVWLPGNDFISNETYFIDSSPDITITNAGNAEEPITIAVYNSETGEIADFSSRGYTRSNIVKPDLAAPGVNIICPTLNNSYGSVSGSGAAAAYTAGIVAKILEWSVLEGHNTAIKGYDIKKLLIRSAERDMDIVYPNNIWGYGKVDIYGLYKLLK